MSPTQPERARQGLSPWKRTGAASHWCSRCFRLAHGLYRSQNCTRTLVARASSLGRAIFCPGRRKAFSAWAHHLNDLGLVGRQSVLGRCIRHLHSSPGACCAGPLRRLLTGFCPLDQVPVPMPGHQSVIDLWREHMDADHLRGIAPVFLTCRTRSAAAAFLAKLPEQLLLELSTRVDIDVTVDRLMRHMLAGGLWARSPLRGGNLLGRPTQRSQTSRHSAPCRCSLCKGLAAIRSAPDAALLGMKA